MSDPETALMQLIYDQYGRPGGAITTACATSSVPAAFLAALIANESGGNPNAQRFEPAIFSQLAQVMMGKRASVQLAECPKALGPDDLLPKYASAGFVQGLARIRDLATSWGLTQVMGWHVLALGLPLTMLQLASGAMDITCRLLALYAKQFDLDLSMVSMPADSDASDFFHCWNAGSPSGATADPLYATHGLARMALYQQIAAAAAAPAPSPAIPPPAAPAAPGEVLH